MQPKPWATDAAELEPMEEEAAAWALLQRIPVDAADRAALALEVAAMFRQLRERAGLSQKQLAEVDPTLTFQLISSWERNERLQLFPRHAAYLVGALGIKVLDLVQPALAARGFDATLPQRVVAAITAHLRDTIEPAGDGEEERPGKLPSLEELAARVGISTPLSPVDAVALTQAVNATGRSRGWAIGQQ